MERYSLTGVSINCSTVDAYDVFIMCDLCHLENFPGSDLSRKCFQCHQWNIERKLKLYYPVSCLLGKSSVSVATVLRFVPFGGMAIFERQFFYVFARLRRISEEEEDRRCLATRAHADRVLLRKPRSWSKSFYLTCVR